MSQIGSSQFQFQLLSRQFPWALPRALGPLGALRGSGPAGALGPSGAFPWVLPWALGLPLGPPLGSPLGPGGALRGPWGLRGPYRDRALPGALQMSEKKHFQRLQSLSISNEDGDAEPSGMAQINSQCEVIWGAAEANYFKLNTCLMCI